MQYTTLGKTGLKVSVAGLGTGGFSRLGLRTGKSEDQSARLIHEAVGLGINFIDTAPSYGTEAWWARRCDRSRATSVVIATKSAVRRGGEMMTPERHGGQHRQFAARAGHRSYRRAQPARRGAVGIRYAIEPLAPALLEQKAKGKIRHIGLTENPIDDFDHDDPEARATRCGLGGRHGRL